MVVKKVREILDRLREEGWVLARSSGSHRQFVHPHKPGVRVTVPGGPNKDVTGILPGRIYRQAVWGTP